MLSWLLQHSPLLYLTQSLWRDEAFSILVAEKPISFFFGKLTFEPPVYYLLLHFWMKIFGESEIAARSLSFLAVAIATVVVIIWAEKLFKKHWLSWFLPVFFFLNPMLLYYAFEARTYGWYILFATLSMYSYCQKKWRLFTISSILGFYTHSFSLIVPAVCAFHYVLSHRKMIRIHHTWSLLRNPMITSLISIGFLITPWLFIIFQSSSKFANSWYYPVDFHLIRSVLGNMFLGYEGTPAFLWEKTAGVSIVLLFLFLFALTSKENRSRNFFFFLTVFLPLVIVIGISFVKPIFVNRYVIAVTIAEIFLITFAIETIRYAWLQKIAALASLVMVIGFNIWFPPLHKKVDIRKTLTNINAVKTGQDVIFAQTPLVFFESIYYSQDRNRVFLYNPNGSPFPWYVGDILVSPAQVTATLPTYPVRAFLVKDDGSFIVIYQTSVVTVPRSKSTRKI